MVTAVQSPEGLDSTELVKRVRDGHNILISGGQGELKGKIFRIGHLGCAGMEQVRRTVKAVAASLAEMGYECAVQAATEAIDEAADTSKNSTIKMNINNPLILSSLDLFICKNTIIFIR